MTEDGFSAALSRAAQLAQRSPSSHNCQPWALAELVGGPIRQRAATMTGADLRQPLALLALDGDRTLTALPAHHAEMLLSCGMYWHLLRRALNALGWRVSVEYRFTADHTLGGLPTSWTPLLVAGFERCRPDPESFELLDQLARTRRTNRTDYTGTPVEPTLFSSDGKAKSQIRLWSDGAARTAVTAAVARYGGRDFAHRAAWRETHSYLRHDEQAAERHGDGFTLDQLLGPQSRSRRALVRLALQPATMQLLRAFGYHRLLAGRLAAVLRTAPAVVGVHTAAAPVLGGDLLDCGETVLGLWLRAAEHGYALHPISVLLQHADVRQRVERELEVTGRLVFLARIGVAQTQVPSTPRLAPEQRLRQL